MFDAVASLVLFAAGGPAPIPLVNSWVQLIATVASVLVLLFVLGLIVWWRAIFRTKLNKLIVLSEKMIALAGKMQVNVETTERLVNTAENLLDLVKGHQHLAAKQRTDAVEAVQEVKRAASEIASVVTGSPPPPGWAPGDPDRRKPDSVSDAAGLKTVGTAPAR